MYTYNIRIYILYIYILSFGISQISRIIPALYYTCVITRSMYIFHYIPISACSFPIHFLHRYLPPVPCHVAHIAVVLRSACSALFEARAPCQPVSPGSVSWGHDMLETMRETMSFYRKMWSCSGLNGSIHDHESKTSKSSIFVGVLELPQYSCVQIVSVNG